MNLQQQQFEDEISLADIFLKLWRRRGLIVILPILSGLIGVFAVLALSVKATTPVIHYVSLTGIEKGSYPNGVAFSPKDMQAPEVLAELSQRLGIENNEDIVKAISVNYGAPTTSGILKKYNDRLSQKGLNSAEVDAINAALDEELRRATEKTAQISVDYQSLNISFEQGAQLAVLLPHVWAEVFTTQFRVLDNTKLSGVSQVEKLSLASSAGVLEASDHVDDILRSLTIMEEDSRLSGLQTSNGVTAADLRVRIEDFNNLYLSAILSRNLGNEDTLTKFYQSDLSLRINMIYEQIAGIDDAISSIQTVISGEQRAVAAGQGYSPDRMQVTGDAISDIVDLVNKSSLSDYLTVLYDEKKELIKKRAVLNLRINKILENVDYGEDFLNISEDRLNTLNVQYVELLIKAREMNRKNNATLSRALGSPHKAGSILPKRSMLIIQLSILVGGFIAAIVALLLPPRDIE